MKVNKMFFCDSFTLGQFGKLNIVGLIPNNSIAIDSLPYNFFSFLILFGTTEDVDMSGLSLAISFISNGKNVDRCGMSLDAPARLIKRGKPPYFFHLAVPVQLKIEQCCNMEINLFSKVGLVCKEIFTFEMGEAPNLQLATHQDVSKVFSGDDSTDLNYLQNLLATAHKTLKIFDSCLDKDSLEILLSKVNRGTEVVVITYDNCKPSFKSGSALSNLFGRISIKFCSKKFKESHDRFVIINGTEYLHFGHSLKDIASGKLSRFSKLINKDEIDDLEFIFKQIEEETLSSI